ncbi:putative sporulation protein YtaF [Pelagirhabdus alkalitolerans]|uniref:Putative sporulation protein YtaF n=1 Tax=Pelagirhabdus alkalitolerans TaxID=1612202 RepID=A0A1G6HKM2_9BACI|nr:sporulation membrane protein YtaF [Pelagirhabdus alkalitolerans]SDB94723.1 putative sporulation protein YtaF [Pelagirhabdus alkalitolerans]
MLLDGFSMLILAIAVSVDSFMVAFGYGLKKLHISFQAMCVIAISSGVLFGVSMLLGNVLTVMMPNELPKQIGAIILIGLGCFHLVDCIKNPKNNKPKKHENTWIPHQIIVSDPNFIDRDKSGDVSGLEVYILGFALSIDASAAGLASALTDISLAVIFVIGLMTLICLWLGLNLGRKYAFKKQMSVLAFIPGILLILLGLSRGLF